MTAMLVIAGCVGLGGTGVLLFLFTTDNTRYYAVLTAMGATPGLLTRVVLVQAAQVSAIGAGLGLGACAIAVRLTADAGYPFRLMWFNPIIGAFGVIMVGLVAAAVSLRPVLRLQPAQAFAPQ
jgi:putative ABC transport system permease protein